MTGIEAAKGVSLIDNRGRDSMMIPFNQSVIGKHAIIDLSGCDPEIIRSRGQILAILKQAAHVAAVTVVGQVEHYFSPEGYSAVLVLEESHLSIHTWPEHHYVSLDLYSCNLDTDFAAVEAFLAKKFRAQWVTSKLLERRFIPVELGVKAEL